MKEVGIFTIQTYNYGNRLQNYASQFVLRNLNQKTKTILMKESKTSLIILSLKKIKAKADELFRGDSKAKFEVFNNNIEYTTDFIGRQNYFVNFRKYDALIVGSDQIWNTTFSWLSNNVFLPFEHSCKIAFSASFGVDSIPYDQQIVDCLNDFKALSVREEAGAKIIKELTGRDATVLVDPTMLLTQEEWRKVSKKPRGAKEGYILTYFLSPKCDEAKAKLEDIKGNKKVYELLNPDDKVAGTAGPSEFLWLFDHADMILTDSFHACVFSFLFNKPFIVYDRYWNEGNMNSRLETLLSKFHIERKYANSGLDNDFWEHDYSEGYKQLEIEREKAIDFLKKALED